MPWWAFFRVGPRRFGSARTSAPSRPGSRRSSASAVASCAIRGRRRSIWRSSCSTLAPGDEVVTSAVTFSTDIAPLVRAGVVPAFVDVEPDTYNVDVGGMAEMIGPRTKAILVPNLIGNAPDWDAIRTVADEHGLLVVEDSCDALGSTLRGTPDRHPVGHLGDLVRAQSHHHRRRDRWHGLSRRRRPDRPLPAAASLGSAL